VARDVRNVRLVVAYEGSGFHGWQIQPGQRTVQGVLEEALRSVMGETVRLTGAGRTDAGVHARGQVATFSAAGTLPARALAPVVNRALPRDVRVREAADAPPGFDARRSALARRYAYRLLDREDLLLERIAWHPRRRIDEEVLIRCTRVLEGEHDFSSFRNTGSGEVTPRCRVFRADWRRWEGGPRLDIVADHFLYHMVRVIVGTAMAAADARDPERAMRDILGARDRRKAGVTVPPQGLCLEHVFYPGETVT
jgi:tRNA pseudouridine38-40 synthase